jgi:UDP-2,3-diacylglucosamine pyrophosphatase LpxH
MATNPDRRHWRTVWISDVHLGTRHAKVDLLLEFLRVARPETLYLVGDLIDGWELRRAWFWTDAHNTLIQKILRKSRKRVRVVYVTGNHDEFLEPFIGFRFGGLQIVREAIHVGLNGRRYLVVHGHQFDGLTHFNRLLERVGSRLYQVILSLNLALNRMRRRLGLGYWSYAAFLKGKAKAAVRYVTRFEEAMAHLAAARRVDGVICGHIHQPEIRRIGNLEYLNCGDWVENCTALVEDYSGNLSLICLHENRLDGAGRRSGASDPGIGRPAVPVPLGA